MFPAIINGRLVYLDQEGREYLRTDFDWGEYFYEEVASVRIGKLSGCINSRGEIVIPAKYNVVGPFLNGYAEVQVNGKRGLIDKAGNEVVEPKFKYVGSCYHDIVGTLMDSQEAIEYRNIRTGKLIFKDEWVVPASPKSGLIVAVNSMAKKASEKFGYRNLDGDWAIEPKYSLVNGFHEGLGCAYKYIKGAERAGFLNLSGRLEIPHEFSGAQVRFKDGIAIVWVGTTKSGGWGAIDKKGKVLFTNLSISLLGNFCNEIAHIWEKKENLSGYLDLNGEVIIPPTYRKGSDFHNHLAWVQDENEWCGYINRSNQWIWKTKKSLLGDWGGPWDLRPEFQ